MKKIIFTLLMFVSVFSFAQTSMTLAYNSMPIQSGDTISPTGLLVNSDNEIYLDITNTTNRPLNLLIVKNLIQPASEGTTLLTCLGVCTEADSLNYTMQAEQSLTGHDGLHITYTTDVQGVSVAKYRIANNDNPEDFVDIYFVFNTDQTSIQSSSMQANALHAYPNPASGNVNINYSYNGNANKLQLVVKNLMGATVQVLPLNANGERVMMNVSEFTPGIYFYSLEADGRAIMTKKLLVR